MSYCHKCGAKLGEEAQFCRKCGTQINGPVTARVAPSQTRGRSFTFPVIILIVLLVVAFFFAVFAFAPLKSVTFNQSNYAPIVPGLETLKLDFAADVADVNIIPTNLSGELVRMNVSAVGSTGLFGSSSHPLVVTFSNQTIDGTLVIASRINREDIWPFSFNLRVTCNIYVERSLILNITAITTVGKVTLDTGSSPMTFNELSLRSTTGNIETTLSPGTILEGYISVSSTTGNIQFFANPEVTGNVSINLASTTGSVSANVSQTQTMGGSIALDVLTTTGSVECSVSVGDGVGFEIMSRSSTGTISVDGSHINEDKSPIHSNNYPSEHNILVNIATTTGSIKLEPNYFPGITASQQEQVRDAAMNYLRNNHAETAQFMQDLNWTGGRIVTGVIGAEEYFFLSGGWNLTISYPVVPNPLFTITADFKTRGAGIPFRVIWKGTWQDAIITETSYEFAQ
jgi:hypothetical protein